jgi:hypothetical protein
MTRTKSSSFTQSFRYTVTPGLGFCLDDGQIEHLSLEWEQDDLVLSAHLRDSTSDQKPSVRAPDVRRALTKTETTTFLDRLYSVKIIDNPTNGCPPLEVTEIDCPSRKDTTKDSTNDGTDTAKHTTICFGDDVIASEDRCRIERFYVDAQEVGVGVCRSDPHYNPVDAGHLLLQLRSLVSHLP